MLSAEFLKFREMLDDDDDDDAYSMLAWKRAPQS